MSEPETHASLESIRDDVQALLQELELDASAPKPAGTEGLMAIITAHPRRPKARGVCIVGDVARDRIEELEGRVIQLSDEKGWSNWMYPEVRLNQPGHPDRICFVARHP